MGYLPLAEEFNKQNINHQKEKTIKVKYNQKDIGVYRPDFIIDNKIILEIKAQTFIPKQTEKQLFYYLAQTDYKLGLLVNFGQLKNVYIKRWINSQVIEKTLN